MSEGRILMGRSVIINEGQYSLLTESFVDLEYHFTTLPNLLSICMEDAVVLSPMVNRSSDNSDRKRKFFLSLTRIRDGRVGYSRNRNVRITFDGHALKDSFKGQSYNYWAGNVFDNKHTYYQKMNSHGNEEARRANAEREFQKDGKWLDFNEFYKRNFNPRMQQHSGNESEDRLLSRKSMIENAHKYILSVDVLLDEYGKDETYYAFQLLKYEQRYNIRFFDDKEEFNKPNGKNINEKLRESYVNGEKVKTPLFYGHNHIDAVLGDALAFMSLAWGDKDIPLKIKEMLSKYGLGQYERNISAYIQKCKNTYSVTGAYDRLRDFGQRIHSRDEANVMQMLTDFILSIGADSLMGAVRILSDRVDYEASKKYGGYASSRIDASVKIPLYVEHGKYVVFQDPKTTKFNDVMRWDENRIQSEADWVASTVDYDRNAYHTTSKNQTSIFMYVKKLLTKGTVYDVFKTLNKMGIWSEFAESNNINIKREELDYYDASRYNTVNAARESDWNIRSKMSSDEIEGWYPRLKK